MQPCQTPWEGASSPSRLKAMEHKTPETMHGHSAQTPQVSQMCAPLAQPTFEPTLWWPSAHTCAAELGFRGDVVEHEAVQGHRHRPPDVTEGGAVQGWGEVGQPSLCGHTGTQAHAAGTHSLSCAHTRIHAHAAGTQRHTQQAHTCTAGTHTHSRHTNMYASGPLIRTSRKSGAGGCGMDTNRYSSRVEGGRGA